MINNEMLDLVKQGKVRVDTLIGVPSYNGTLCPETQRCVEQLLFYNMRNNNPVTYKPAYGSMISENRNKILAAAIEMKTKYCLMVDSDMVFPMDTLDRLKTHKKAISSVKYHAKQPPFVPIMFRKVSNYAYKPILNYPQELIEVDAVGGGVLLIEVDAVKHIKPPWFSMPSITSHVMWTKLQELFEPQANRKKIIKEAEDIYKGMKDIGSVLGEDCYFCELAKREGIKIYVDTTIPVEHIGSYAFGEQDFNASMQDRMEQMKQNQPRQKIVLAS